MNQHLVNRAMLVVVLIVISALFFTIIKSFLSAIFLAALFAALFYPLYERVLRFTGDRESISSLLTLFIIVLFVFVPFALILTSVVSQAVEVANAARPFVQQQLAEPGMITERLQSLPFYDKLEPYKNFLVTQLGETVGSLSRLTVDLVQSATLGTVNALLMGFVVLYTMFFLFVDGDKLLYYVLYYLPLSDEEESLLLERFTSVTKATLRGTAVIGVLQGILNGLAFAVVGIPSALFWGVAMVFLSVVPGIGTALVWIPAVIFLIVSGEIITGIGLALFCALVVGSIDNVLRPKLVGDETQLHELMIFFSTLGGLIVFGFWGFVIGPIIAALFVTVWGLYGYEFREWLPTTAFTPRKGPIDLHSKFEIDEEKIAAEYEELEAKRESRDADLAANQSDNHEKSTTVDDDQPRRT